MNTNGKKVKTDWHGAKMEPEKKRGNRKASRVGEEESGEEKTTPAHASGRTAA